MDFYEIIIITYSIYIYIFVRTLVFEINSTHGRKRGIFYDAIDAALHIRDDQYISRQIISLKKLVTKITDIGILTFSSLLIIIIIISNSVGTDFNKTFIVQ